MSIAVDDYKSRFEVYERAIDAVSIDRAEVTGNMLTVYLSDGRIVSVPTRWFRRLDNALPSEQNVIEIGEDFLSWPMIDEDISLRTILLGPGRGRESERSFAQWRRWIDARRAGATDAEFASEFED
jgi:hypothetical protein